MADLELPPRPPLERVPWLALILLLIIATWLRLPGLQWGLPDQTHIFSYHPDEFHSLRGAISLILGGDPNPHFFNYGSLYLYLTSLSAVLADSGALGTFTGEGVAQLLRDWTVAARHLNLVLALLTVVAVYLVGRQLLGVRPGLLAAAAIAVMPLHVLHSHYATVDVPQALFIALALLYAVKIGQRPVTRDYLLAGLFAGLAMSTKYNGAVVLVAPLVAHFAALRDDEKAVRLVAWQPLAMLAMAALAFLVTSPYTLLDWEAARRDILFELGHMRAGEEPARSADPNGFLFHGLGLTLTTTGATLVGLLGLVGIIARRVRRAGLGLIVFGVVWFVMISLANVRYCRYEVALAPVLAVLVAAAPVALQRKRVEARLVGVLVAGASVALGMWVSAQIGMTLRRDPDPRDLGLQTVEQVVPPGRTVGMAWEPWFNAPPLDRVNGGQELRSKPVWSQFEAPVRPLVVTAVDPAKLAAERPFAYTLSNFEIRDALRANDPNAKAFREYLSANYVPDLVAKRPAPLAGLLGWQPPQDWLYPFPEVTVYLLKSGGGETTAGR